MAKRAASAVVKIAEAGTEEVTINVTSRRPEDLAQPITLTLRTGERGLALVATKEDADAAAQFLRGVRERIRAIKAHYKAVKDPVNAAVKKIREQEAADLKPWEDADASVAAPLLAWTTAEKQRAEAENRRRVQEAQERAEAERQQAAAALRRAATSVSSASERKALNQQAKAVERAPALPVVSGPATEAHKPEGISVPTRWVAEVFDPMALLRAVVAGDVAIGVVMFDQSWLDGQARAHERNLRIPGVVPVEKPHLSARGF
jgi:hypothetical protein